MRCLATMHHAATVDSFTDSEMPKNTYSKGLARARFAANSDLWGTVVYSLQRQRTRSQFVLDA